MNKPKKAEKGRCSICGKHAVIENHVCNLPVCQRRIEEGRVEKLSKMTDNNLLSEAVRVIARQTIVTAQAMGINLDAEHAVLMETACRIDELDKENYMLRSALHDAINAPMGIVPYSAEDYYEPSRWNK